VLVLSRSPGEAVTIDDVVKLTVLEIRGRTVKLGIDAPSDVNVDREEIHEAKCRRTRLFRRFGPSRSGRKRS
jgi:carbon storage regulator